MSWNKYYSILFINVKEIWSNIEIFIWFGLSSLNLVKNSLETAFICHTDKNYYSVHYNVTQS